MATTTTTTTTTTYPAGLYGIEGVDTQGVKFAFLFASKMPFDVTDVAEMAVEMGFAPKIATIGVYIMQEYPI